MSHAALSPRSIVIYGLLLVSAIVSWWVRDLSEEPLVVLDPGIAQADYHMQNLKLRTLGEDGVIRHYLSAETLAHYPFDDSTHFKEPQVILYRDGVPAWVVVARTGKLDNEKQHLMLKKDVEIYQGEEMRGDKAPLRLEALEMMIDLENEVASTDKKVHASQLGVGTVDGVGMRLDLRKDRLEIHSQVHFVYENP